MALARPGFLLLTGLVVVAAGVFNLLNLTDRHWLGIALIISAVPVLYTSFKGFAVARKTDRDSHPGPDAKKE